MQGCVSSLALTACKGSINLRNSQTKCNKNAITSGFSAHYCIFILFLLILFYQYSKDEPPRNSRRSEVGGIWSSGMGRM